MKAYFLTCVLLSCLSLLFGQTKQNLKLSKSKVVSIVNPISLGSDNYFSFRTDDNYQYLMMQYSNLRCEQNIPKTTVDTIDYSPYKSKLYSYVSEDRKEYVILWVTEYEYYPDIIAYYLKEHQLFKIGRLEISRPCPSCESFEYPIESIIVIKINDNIEFSFSKDVNFKLNDTEWKLYKPGLLKYQYNILQKKVEIIR